VNVDKALDLDPSSPSAYYVRAYVKWHQKDYRGANQDLTRTIEIQPDYYEAYSFRASVLRALRNYDAAISDYSHALLERDTNRETIYADRGAAITILVT
jgi:Tfp pilus assembly protein PilF